MLMTFTIAERLMQIRTSDYHAILRREHDYVSLIIIFIRIRLRIVLGYNESFLLICHL